MKKIILTSVLLAMAACNSVEAPMRISTPLIAREFNAPDALYQAQSTLVAAEKMTDGKKTLTVRVDTYAGAYVPNNPSLAPSSRDSLRHTEIRFSKKNVDDYVAAIDKYAKWAALATQRKDAFDKEISAVPTWASSGDGVLRFTFHSAGNQDHFLVITFAGGSAGPSGQALYFDAANTLVLKQLLQTFATDKLQKADINRIYQ